MLFAELGKGVDAVVRKINGRIARLAAAETRRAEIEARSPQDLTPVTTAGCLVGIGMALDARPAPSAPGLAVRAQPNPCRGRVQLSIQTEDGAEPDLRVLDMQGRTVRQLPVAAGTRHVEWDGRTDDGLRAPAGVYLVRLRAGAAVRQARVTVLW